jgi:ribonuclease P protein subunit RPR2
VSIERSERTKKESGLVLAERIATESTEGTEVGELGDGQVGRKTPTCQGASLDADNPLLWNASTKLTSLRLSFEQAFAKTNDSNIVVKHFQTHKMAKDKSTSIPNKHLHARTTFLFQAATYLTLQASANGQTPRNEENYSEEVPGIDKSSGKGHPVAARHLGSHLRAVSHKGQVRLSASVKRSMCKVCSAILIPGQTATHVLQNESRGGKKPWADVLEVCCNICGSKKRFPVGATRQQRKTSRTKKPNRSYETIEQTTTPTTESVTEHSPASN